MQSAAQSPFFGGGFGGDGEIVGVASIPGAGAGGVIEDGGEGVSQGGEEEQEGKEKVWETGHHEVSN